MPSCLFVNFDVSRITASDDVSVEYETKTGLHFWSSNMKNIANTKDACQASY